MGTRRAASHAALHNRGAYRMTCLLPGTVVAARSRDPRVVKCKLARSH